MVNIEDVHYAAAFIDPVDHAIGATPGAVTAGERPEQRLADPIRVDRKRRIAALQHSSGNGFRGAAGRSLAGRQAGNGSRTAVRVRPSRAGDAAPGQVLANGGHVSAPLAALQGCQAFRDTRNRVGVTEDFQGHLQALKVIDREQDSLGLSVAGQDDPLMLLAYSPGQLRQACLGFGQRHRRRGCRHG